MNIEKALVPNPNPQPKTLEWAAKWVGHSNLLRSSCAVLRCLVRDEQGHQTTSQYMDELQSVNVEGTYGVAETWFERASLES